MTYKEPYAFRLAYDIEGGVVSGEYKLGSAADCAAGELRRLHKENKALVEALNKIKAHMDTDEYAWGVAADALAKATGENT